MSKNCIACGMTMNNKEDYAMGDVKKDYCQHCARPDGSMQSFSEKLQSLSAFIIKTQGLDSDVATSTAKSMMLKLPAWKEYRE